MGKFFNLFLIIIELYKLYRRNFIGRINSNVNSWKFYKANYKIGRKLSYRK